MAYPHSKYEVKLKSAADLNSVADIAAWGPGYVPHRIHAVALVINNVIAAAGVVKFDKRPTAGSDTGRGDGDVAIINLATSHDGGEVVYKDGLNVILNPGQEVVAEVTDATGASDTAEVIIYVEPVWENPDNISAMVETA